MSTPQLERLHEHCHRLRLYQIEQATDDVPAQSYPDYLDLRDRNKSLDGLALYDRAFSSAINSPASRSPCSPAGRSRVRVSSYGWLE